MRVLAMDTALEACSVALDAVAGDRAVTRSEIIGRGHAERLPVLLNEVVNEAAIAWRDIDRIAVTVGPGSFTGIRIGIATARGLALATEAELVGITTLAVHAAVARAIAGDLPILALLPAAGGNLYGALHAADGTVLQEPTIADCAHFAEFVRSNEAVRLAGAGAPLLAAFLGGLAEAGIVHRQSAPDIAALLQLAHQAPVSDRLPVPLYLRPPDAVPPPAGVPRL